MARADVQPVTVKARALVASAGFQHPAWPAPREDIGARGQPRLKVSRLDGGRASMRAITSIFDAIVLPSAGEP